MYGFVTKAFSFASLFFLDAWLFQVAHTESE